MYKRISQKPAEQKKLISLDELREYLSMGRSYAARVGIESGALIRFGRRNLYDRAIIDAYLDTLRDRERA